MITAGKGGRQGLIAEQDLVPQMRKQLRNNAKRSSDKKERSPPVHGNHSALYQLAVSKELIFTMKVPLNHCVFTINPDSVSASMCWCLFSLGRY